MGRRSNSGNSEMMNISVASRGSKLSQAQVAEVEKELKVFYPHVKFMNHFTKTSGDLDLKTSLRTLGATDFFTKEIDDLVLNGTFRLGIHSAKDLPVPLTSGLSIVAVTKGLDSRDVLVMRENDTFEKLPVGGVIASSSLRRDESVKKLRPDLTFQDIRGTIEVRLDSLFQGNVDGVVIAECALIRLNLTHLNRYFLPGPTATLQGRLAIVAKESDYEMKKLFSCIDSKNL